MRRYSAARSLRGSASSSGVVRISRRPRMLFRPPSCAHLRDRISRECAICLRGSSRLGGACSPDQARSDTARTARQVRLGTEPEPGCVPPRDDTLAPYLLCTHPVLTSASAIAIALTLRAVAGLTMRQIAHAFLVPEATMAQRISRAKQRLVGIPLDNSPDRALFAAYLRDIVRRCSADRHVSLDLFGLRLEATRDPAIAATLGTWRRRAF